MGPVSCSVACVFTLCCSLVSPCDGYYKRLYEEEKKKKEVSKKVSWFCHMMILNESLTNRRAAMRSGPKQRPMSKNCSERMKRRRKRAPWRICPIVCQHPALVPPSHLRFRGQVLVLASAYWVRARVLPLPPVRWVVSTQISLLLVVLERHHCLTSRTYKKWVCNGI